MIDTPRAPDIIRREHSAVAAVLRSILPTVEQAGEDPPERFFDVLRAMLFYIDEFPEQRHHPKESNLLFPRLAAAAPELMPVIERLEREHMQGEAKVRELQHLLLAWELVGGSRRAAFIAAATEYVSFYLEHMRIEETQLLPAAERLLPVSAWAEIDRAFAHDGDPLAGAPRDPAYDRLFTRIVLATPAPIGLGRALTPTP
ncbi:hemerythrin domain-containing protein [Ramlibacter sp. MMS24-I3-19]|uniref:hemerythrin domain-containing protein n=1 Tax=Ramlibacter sp. MMS24-I3-19 TaxID=3416606 RepID=UPI003CFF94F3